MSENGVGRPLGQFRFHHKRQRRPSVGVNGDFHLSPPNIGVTRKELFAANFEEVAEHVADEDCEELLSAQRSDLHVSVNEEKGRRTHTTPGLHNRLLVLKLAIAAAEGSRGAEVRTQLHPQRVGEVQLAPQRVGLARFEVESFPFGLERPTRWAEEEGAEGREERAGWGFRGGVAVPRIDALEVCGTPAEEVVEGLKGVLLVGWSGGEEDLESLDELIDFGVLRSGGGARC